MTKLDFKSAVIGFLSATTLVACIAASNQTSSQVGPYLPLTESSVVDSRTGIAYRVGKHRVEVDFAHHVLDHHTFTKADFIHEHEEHVIDSTARFGARWDELTWKEIRASGVLDAYTAESVAHLISEIPELGPEYTASNQVCEDMRQIDF